ncbi:uncharacterized protein LOC119730344 [Patiria miniata]|uniref:Reverse transcriptase n=1 Tax=Patiria miniata TaxID=46514 RepID=A0A914A6M0_PATMI|nr:uncharacterized protein LOC119730344 [Patiria miniata]
MHYSSGPANEISNATTEPKQIYKEDDDAEYENIKHLFVMCLLLLNLHLELTFVALVLKIDETGLAHSEIGKLVGGVMYSTIMCVIGFLFTGQTTQGFPDEFVPACIIAVSIANIAVRISVCGSLIYIYKYIRTKAAQQADPTLRKIRELSDLKDEKTGEDGCSSRFVTHGGLLYRQFQSERFSQGNVIHQLVVPAKYRKLVMKLGHEAIIGGHQGAKKTADKILTDFFWPGIHSEVTRFCRSCDVCQRTVQKGRVTRVPLGTMPLIDTPFDRVAVDIVGPIHPMTSNKNRYILTIVDYATRYPEAIALPRIEATRVAEALVDVYTRVGIPREVLTDKGSQFTPDVMKEVSRLLSIRQLTTTPYHPACNGMVERFNASLKNMLKRMCAERPTDWDRYLNPLLFAYRETPHDSTGFSPFELLYGRTVRGPMAILKELWTGKVESDTEVKTTYQYVIDLKERLENTCNLAQKELMKSQRKNKMYYNRKSRERSFKPGDKVLILLPTDKNKLLLQWKGPFDVLAKIGTCDYRLDLHGNTKTFHANLLKRYVQREEASLLSVVSCDSGIVDVICTATVEDEDGPNDESGHVTGKAGLIEFPVLKASETVADVTLSGDLSKEQTHEVRRLLGNFSDIMTDLPSETTVGVHDIKLSTDERIHQKPYPLPHNMRDTVADEIKQMMELKVIEPSDSPYSFPIVIVKKPDGSNRFCIDFRKLNRVTIFDAEPLPNPDEIFASLSADRFFTKLDLTKGYWQIPLTEESKPKTAFATPFGLFQFRVMPFGLINAPATFSRLMRTVLREVLNVHNYIDDILIHTTSWQDHLKTLKEVLKRLREAKLSARPKKCQVGFSSIHFLGHIIGHGQLKPHPDNIEKIRSAPRPTTKKQMRSFLGLCNYYRKFIPDFAAIAVPLTDKTKGREPNKIIWTESQELAFNSLKKHLTSRPILCLPDFERQFILRTDASDIGIGAMLLQEYDDTKQPVAFASKKLLPRERAYSAMERECLAIVWGIQKFQVFLDGKEFVLETDHQPLVYLQKAKLINSRIMRWALSLQPYKFLIEAI